MKAINLTLPINAIAAMVAPMISVPVSQGKTFAGYLL